MEINIDRLIECRKKLKISKQEAAKRVGVSQPTYLRYESGERKPTLHVLRNIANVFETSVDYLTGKTDSPEYDFIVIDKKMDPDIFYIIENHQNWNESQIKRIKAYVEKINENIKNAPKTKTKRLKLKKKEDIIETVLKKLKSNYYN